MAFTQTFQVNLLVYSVKVGFVTLYEFFGDGCPHCEKMEPKVEKLEEQEDVSVDQLEVWNDQGNAEKQKELDNGKCGGVPFFYNTESEEFICGETDMENLRKWALNKDIN